MELTPVLVREIKMKSRLCPPGYGVTGMLIDCNDNIVVFSRYTRDDSCNCYFVPLRKGMGHPYTFSTPVSCQSMAFSTDGKSMIAFVSSSENVIEFDMKPPHQILRHIEIDKTDDDISQICCTSLIASSNGLIIFTDSSNDKIHVIHDDGQQQTFPASIPYTSSMALVGEQIWMSGDHFNSIWSVDKNTGAISREVELNDRDDPWTLAGSVNIGQIGDWVVVSRSNQSLIFVDSVTGRFEFKATFKHHTRFVVTSDKLFVLIGEDKQSLLLFRLVNKQRTALFAGLHGRAGARGPILAASKRSSIFDPQALCIALQLAGAWSLFRK